jgi:hypothetical protein
MRGLKLEVFDMLVRATKRGFHRSMKEAGDVFEYEGRIDGSSWLVPATAEVQTVEEEREEEPTTMYEIQKRKGGRPSGSKNKPKE